MQCSRCGQTMTQGPGGWYICYGCGNSQPPLYVGRIGGTRGMPRLRRAAGAAPEAPRYAPEASRYQLWWSGMPSV